MALLQPVRGTHDLMPGDERRHRRIAEVARAACERHGYAAIQTPIFEFTELFQRSAGETSDIVSKEMYSFEDRGGEGLTLRPENTAGVVRAFLSAGLTQSLPQKFFYYGPMFRYERPQKGRQRQFHQIGAELIGAAAPLADVEMIACAAEILDELGVGGACRLLLNTLGDGESRAGYRAALVAYFTRRGGDLSEDSRTRLTINPLRILDSKDPGDRALLADAPEFDAYMNATSRTFFDAVRRGLDALNIDYAHDKTIVRGLDYYSHTVFEFVTDALGAQRTVLAGGRYDGLVEDLGGPSTPAVGWAAGVERLAMLCDEPPPPPRPVALIPVGDAAELVALKVARQLRRAGLSVDLGLGGTLKKRLARADKAGARFAVILGDGELARGVAGVRHLDGGEQRDVALDQLAAALNGEATL